MLNFFKKIPFAILLGFISQQAAAQAAQHEVAVYGGIQESPHSTATFDGERFTVGWEGKSFDMPPYYGLRYTNWRSDKWGVALNFVHAKAYANEASRSKNGFSTMEFTDGANPITLNVFHRYDPISGFQPYTGLGLGISVPHVELQKEGSNVRTFEFQFGGPVLAFTGGVKREMAPQWSAFAEYGFHYLMLNVKHDGLRYKTNLITNALNVGVNYEF